VVTQVSIDRSGMPGAPPPLVIGTHPASANYWLDAAGLGRPGRGWERTYASAPDWHGEVLVRARRTNLSLPLTVYVQGNSSTQVENRLDDLLDAVGQLAYDVTVTVDDEATTYACDPADAEFGDGYDPGMVQALMRKVTLAVPTYAVEVG
jgi:hypothetical protein